MPVQTRSMTRKMTYVCVPFFRSLYAKDTSYKAKWLSRNQNTPIHKLDLVDEEGEGIRVQRKDGKPIAWNDVLSHLDLFLSD